MFALLLHWIRQCRGAFQNPSQLLDFSFLGSLCSKRAAWGKNRRSEENITLIKTLKLDQSVCELAKTRINFTPYLCTMILHPMLFKLDFLKCIYLSFTESAFWFLQLNDLLCLPCCPQSAKHAYVTPFKSLYHTLLWEMPIGLLLLSE